MKMIFALSCRAKSNNSEKVYCVNIGVYTWTQFKSHQKHDLINFSLPTWTDLEKKRVFGESQYLNRMTSNDTQTTQFDLSVGCSNGTMVLSFLLHQKSIVVVTLPIIKIVVKSCIFYCICVIFWCFPVILFLFSVVVVCFFVLYLCRPCCRVISFVV